MHSPIILLFTPTLQALFILLYLGPDPSPALFFDGSSWISFFPMERKANLGRRACECNSNGQYLLLFG